jgi:hypothetical protein
MKYHNLVFCDGLSARRVLSYCVSLLLIHLVNLSKIPLILTFSLRFNGSVNLEKIKSIFGLISQFFNSTFCYFNSFCSSIFFVWKLFDKLILYQSLNYFYSCWGFKIMQLHYFHFSEAFLKSKCSRKLYSSIEETFDSDKTLLVCFFNALFKYINLKAINNSSCVGCVTLFLLVNNSLLSQIVKSSILSEEFSFDTPPHTQLIP